MRGMEKIGRLTAALLLAVVGMAVGMTASAAVRTATGTNISARITSPDTFGANKDGTYEPISLKFEFFRTSSDYLKTGAFQLALTGSKPGSVSTWNTAGATCSLSSTTQLSCTIAGDGIDPVIIEVVLQPADAFITYNWNVRPGSSSDVWLSETNVALTASGDTAAGAVGVNSDTVTALTSDADGLKGVLTAKGKANTGLMLVSVQEVMPTNLTSQCTVFPHYVCVKFGANKSDGTKLQYPGDLGELLSFWVYANPVSTGLVGKSLSRIKLYYSGTEGDPNPTALKNCTKNYSRSYSAVPCIKSRSIDEFGFWVFELQGWENGFVVVYD